MIHRPVNDYVADRIRILRQERRWGVETMARLTGIPLGSYSMIEPKRYRISLEKLFACQLALGTPIDRIWPASYAKASPVTPEKMEAVIRQAESRLPKRVTLERIVKAMEQEFGFSLEQLAAPSKDRALSRARIVMAALADRTPGLTQQEAARAVRRHEAGISKSLKVARQDPAFAEQVNRVQDILDAQHMPEPTEKEWSEEITVTVRERERLRQNVRHLERIRRILQPRGAAGSAFDRVMREFQEIAFPA